RVCGRGIVLVLRSRAIYCGRDGGRRLLLEGAQPLDGLRLRRVAHTALARVRQRLLEDQALRVGLQVVEVAPAAGVESLTHVVGDAPRVLPAALAQTGLELEIFLGERRLSAEHDVGVALLLLALRDVADRCA